MIRIQGVTKKFNDFIALENIDLNINDNSVFAVIGLNGVGKSTLLRLISGIYKIDSGKIEIDGEDIAYSTKKKEEIVFIPDDPYYDYNATPKSMGSIYSCFYPQFDKSKYTSYLHKFNCEENKKLSVYSKGMRRKLFIALALACNVKYMIIDEVFDGLDSVAKNEFKEIIASIVEDNSVTVILSSQSLKELEDIVDSFALINDKKVVGSGRLDQALEMFTAYQLVYDRVVKEDLFNKLSPTSLKINGKFVDIILEQNEKVDYVEELKKTNPLYIENKAISLEDYFESMIIKGDMK